VSEATIDEKLAALDAWMRRSGRVIVCYSGGVDSAFVLAAAHRALGRAALGLTAVSPSLADLELEDARRVAASIGAAHRVVTSNEIHDESYQKNGPDRCFHCKSELYRISERVRAETGADVVANGTNVDDLGDYRPGLEAAANAAVKSPLVELGFTKADVREGAKRLGLEVWDKPAAACLSSRIPFGTRVTEARLARIGGFEADLRRMGFRRVRVRFHLAAEHGEAAIARVELDPSDIARACSEEARGAIVASGKAHGFLFVTVDLAGYRMGSHNELLEKERRALPVVR